MKLNLNGRDVDIPPTMEDDRLLWVLRDHFGLYGAKYGCGAGVCGACTVHLDGEAVPSCSISAKDVGDRRIVTLEGLGADSPDGIHPVQRAWIAQNVPQCGYCQNGQIMAASALLKQNPNAQSQDIDTAMDRILCRCGTQVRIRAAVALAQTSMTEKS